MKINESEIYYTKKLIMKIDKIIKIIFLFSIIALYFFINAGVNKLYKKQNALEKHIEILENIIIDNGLWPAGLEEPIK